MPLLHLVVGVPTPSPTPLIRTGTDCIKDVHSFCYDVYQGTGQAWLGRSSDWLIIKPAKILLIVVVALLARALIRRVVGRLARRAAEGTVPGVLQHGPASALLDAPLLSERRKQRADTMGTVLKSLATGIVFTVAVLMALAEIDLNIAPLLASAGILGVAIGFGAQTLVKDFIAGVFMILEDQYGVGDVVDLETATGTVESVGLRVTRVRSVDGAVWYVRNGEIVRVGNMSQGWARAVLDVQVDYGSDIAQVRQILTQVAQELTQDEEYADLVIEEPEVWGVESISATEGVVVRLVVKTVPLKQWVVSRELRERIKKALDVAGVQAPLPRAVLGRGPRADGGAS